MATGEAVVLDEQGRSDCALLQQSLGGRGGKRTSREAMFVAFDLLYFDEHDPRQLELFSRRLTQGLVTDREDEKRPGETRTDLSGSISIATVLQA